MDSEFSIISVRDAYRNPDFRWGTVLPAGCMCFVGDVADFTAFCAHLCDTGYGDVLRRLHLCPTVRPEQASAVYTNDENYANSANNVPIFTEAQLSKESMSWMKQLST